jgi:hypothetical protein
MSIATNLLLIVLGINLMLFIFGSSETNSPMIATIKNIFTGDTDWTYLLDTIGYSASVYLLLMGFIFLASLFTGSVGLSTGGSGQGAVMVLQIIAIAIFAALALMPNFAALGFPSALDPTNPYPILEIIQIVFGSLITVTVISLLRGY